MKKLLTTTVLISTLSIPAVAVGGPGEPPEYGGKLEKGSDSYFGFDVVGKGDDRKIRNGIVQNMRFSGSGCERKEQGGDLERSVPVKKNGTFDKTVEYLFGGSNPRRGAAGIRYHLQGDLDGDRATGQLRIKLLGSGGCDSGAQDFDARRPAPPLPDGPF